ncbi:unnamed protein product [marine sediment metagenome]|uniref:Uncharacterized protein n=1 Tax=marine sediment metagenome TaxID=412755 RepID=X1CDM2_9ZZZZ
MPTEGTDSLDFNKINSALEGAFMVATISEKSKSVERIKRIEISEDLGMLEALRKYIENNRELIPQTDKLLNRAQILEKELEDTERGI